MGCQLYLILSGMMFLEFAIWGAWSPVLATRLLGPLKMSGKQTGWIYGTIPLASIVSPLIAGQIADQWLATFAYHTSAGWTTFIWASLSALMIAVVAVGYQSIKAAHANPVEALKYE